MDVMPGTYLGGGSRRPNMEFQSVERTARSSGTFAFFSRLRSFHGFFFSFARAAARAELDPG